MLRWIAAALIIMSGAGLGFSMADVFRRRPQQLRQLQFALTILGSEIRFRQRPLPGALTAVAGSTPAPIGHLFSDLAAALGKADGKGPVWAWEQVKPAREIALAQEDLALLANLMQVLGGGSVVEQSKQLELHLEHLRQLELEAERARAANEKIWRYLGVFAGIALVLVLL